MNRIVAFLYGTLCYLLFLATFLYGVAFLGNFGPIKTIDGTAALPFGQAGLDQYASPGPLRRTAQRDGQTGIQAVVDAPGSQASRTKHVRALFKLGSPVAVSFLATDGRDGLGGARSS